MPKYKVGEKVVIRKDLIANEDNWYAMEDGEADDSVTEAMVVIANSRDFVTIKEVFEKYLIAEDNGDWCWTDGMIAGLYEDPQP